MYATLNSMNNEHQGIQSLTTCFHSRTLSFGYGVNSNVKANMTYIYLKMCSFLWAPGDTCPLHVKWAMSKRPRFSTRVFQNVHTYC